MAQKIKAIETKYNGYRFRSRLEARWAVFFDEMGIDYEYELEGFELPSGARYLPDFYLKHVHNGLYVEIKPQYPTFSELKKYFEFAFKHNGLLVFCTSSPKGTGFLINKYTTKSFDDLVMYLRENFGDEDKDALAYQIMECLSHNGHVALSPDLGTGSIQLSYMSCPAFFVGRFLNAEEVSKQARFERGEAPQGPRER